MKRRDAVLALLAIGALPLAVRAQRPGRVYKIGVLSAGRGPASAEFPLSKDMAKLGWVEGKNVVYEARWAEDRLERLPGLAAELVRLKVDVIYTIGTLAPLAAKRATTTIPIVMAAAGDPLGSGLVANFARPGGNVTGNSMMVAELGGRRLQMMKELRPGVSRVAIFWNAANPYSTNVFRATRDAAKTLRVQLQSLELRSPEDFKEAAESALRQRAGALLVVEDPLTTDLRKQFADFAARNRIPALYGLKEFVEAGGLISYGVSVEDLRRRAAVYVDKILRGAKPGDLPVQQPTQFEIVINRSAAAALGLTIPQAVLVQATELIE